MSILDQQAKPWWVQTDTTVNPPRQVWIVAGQAGEGDFERSEKSANVQSRPLGMSSTESCLTEPP